MGVFQFVSWITDIPQRSSFSSIRMGRTLNLNCFANGKMKIAACPRCLLTCSARNTVSSRSFHSRIVSNELALKYHPDVNKTQESQQVFSGFY